MRAATIRVLSLQTLDADGAKCLRASNPVQSTDRGMGGRSCALVGRRQDRELVLVRDDKGNKALEREAKVPILWL